MDETRTITLNYQQIIHISEAVERDSFTFVNDAVKLYDAVQLEKVLKEVIIYKFILHIFNFFCVSASSYCMDHLQGHVFKWW